MTTNFHIWKTNRTIYSKFLHHNSLAQLNKIPEGFNNNLIWNIGHVIVVQQRLVYALSGLPMAISDELFAAYKPGTKPEEQVSEETVN
ncbi:MAG: DinB family protein, partial [Algoriphagus sp.]